MGCQLSRSLVSLSLVTAPGPSSPVVAADAAGLQAGPRAGVDADPRQVADRLGDPGSVLSAAPAVMQDATARVPGPLPVAPSESGPGLARCCAGAVPRLPLASLTEFAGRATESDKPPAGADPLCRLVSGPGRRRLSPNKT